MNAEIQKTGSASHALGIRDILTIFFKHKWKIILIFLFIFISSLIIPFFIPPTYEAETTLLVKVGREHIFTSEVGDVAPQMKVDLQTLVDPEIAILTSPDLIQRVLNALKLEVIYPKFFENPPTSMTPADAALIEFKKNLVAQQRGESNVINVTFQHKVPEITAKAVNLLATFWKEQHLKIFSTPQAPFLEEQTQAYRDRLEQSETHLQNFKQKFGISSLSNQQKLILEQRQELDTRFKSTQNDIQGLTTKIESVTGQMKRIPKEIPLSTVNKQRLMIDDTKRELLELRRKEQELAGKFQETSRILVDLRKEISLIEKFIQEQEEELGDTVTSGRNPVYQQLELELLSAKSERAALSTQTQVIMKQLGELDEQLSQLGQLQKQVDMLQREVENDQENLRRYLEKVEAARIAQEMDRQQIANVSVIQSATVPVKPVKPKKLLIALFGLLLGVLSGLGLALLLEVLQSGYTRPEHASRDLGLPILASVSHKG